MGESQEIQLFHGTIGKSCGFKKCVVVPIDVMLHLKFKAGEKGSGIFLKGKPAENAEFVLIIEKSNRHGLCPKIRKKLYNYSTKLVIPPKCLPPAKAQSHASSLILLMSFPTGRNLRQKTLALRSFHNSQQTSIIND
jgi:hypothetical protein